MNVAFQMSGEGNTKHYSYLMGGGGGGGVCGYHSLRGN